MTDGGLIPSQTYKDLVACEDNTAVKMTDRPLTTNDLRLPSPQKLSRVMSALQPFLDVIWTVS